MHVRFLNGDLVIYDTDKLSDVRGQICTAHDIHPLQLRLVRCENESKEHENKTLNALILPRKTVVLSDYGSLIKDDLSSVREYAQYSEHHWIRDCVNESVLKKLLSLDPLPPAVFANPHPLVLEFLFTTGYGLIETYKQNINPRSNHPEKKYMECVCQNFFSNPSDIVVDKILIGGWQYTHFPRWIPSYKWALNNPNPRIAKYYYETFIHEGRYRHPDGGLVEVGNCVAAAIMYNLGATQEMLDTLVLKNSVFAGNALMSMYDEPCVPENLTLWKALNRHFPQEYTGREIIDMIVERKYTELVEYLNASDTKSKVQRYFPILSAITDSQEVVDWLLAKVAKGFYEFENENGGIERIIQTLSANPNPRVVEWAMGEKKAQGKDAFFANPHPLAVEHNRKLVVEAIISLSSFSPFCSVEFERVLSRFNMHPASHPPNPELVLGVLVDLMDKDDDEVVLVQNKIMLSMLLITLSQTDVEIVFE